MLFIGEMHRNGIQHHPPLLTLTLLSVYYLFYYVVWFDFMPINVIECDHNMWQPIKTADINQKTGLLPAL